MWYEFVLCYACSSSAPFVFRGNLFVAIFPTRCPMVVDFLRSQVILDGPTSFLMRPVFRRVYVLAFAWPGFSSTARLSSSPSVVCIPQLSEVVAFVEPLLMMMGLSRPQCCQFCSAGSPCTVWSDFVYYLSLPKRVIGS